MWPAVGGPHAGFRTAKTARARKADKSAFTRCVLCHTQCIASNLLIHAAFTYLKACREGHAPNVGVDMLLMVPMLLLQGKSCSPGVELASSRRGKTPTPAIMLIPKKNRKEVYKYLFKGDDR